MRRLIIPCLPGYSGYGMIYFLLLGLFALRLPPARVFCYFAKLLRSLIRFSSRGFLCKTVWLTRAETSGDEVSPCMRCIVLPLAGFTRLLDFWVRMADSYTSICQWGVTQSGDRPKKYTNIRVCIYIYIYIYIHTRIFVYFFGLSPDWVTPHWQMDV